jgi:hypothetical protein
MLVLLINIIGILYKLVKKWKYKKALANHIQKTEKEQLEILRKIEKVKS